jgi:UDP-N-acetylglucosamine 2-epimerase (non-hydrolysing)
MPEEINRIVTDVLSDLLLVSEPSGLENLRREGVPDAKVRLVGNVMIDTLVRELDAARALHMPARFGLTDSGYAMVTLHRPSNVDEPLVLEALLRRLRRLSAQLPMLFAVHPRTRSTAERHGLTDLLADSVSFRCLGPLPYRENLGLLASARLVLTDSGGIQEETSALGVPCLTLRENTERPVTVVVGSSCLVGHDIELIESSFSRVIAGQWKTSQAIPLWDGHAGSRVATAVSEWLDQRARSQ